MVVGMMWNWSFPINKNLWTSSYVVFTAGMACVTLATIMWLIEEHHISWWTKPFVIYGMNPIVAFVGSGVLARFIYTLWKVQYNGQPTSMEAVIYKSVFEPFLEPKNASLAMAFVTVLFWFGILLVLYRRKIFLKVRPWGRRSGTRTESDRGVLSGATLGSVGARMTLTSLRSAARVILRALAVRKRLRRRS